MNDSDLRERIERVKGIQARLRRRGPTAVTVARHRRLDRAITRLLVEIVTFWPADRVQP